MTVLLAGRTVFPYRQAETGLRDDAALHKNEVTKLSLVTVYDSSQLHSPEFPKGGFAPSLYSALKL